MFTSELAISDVCTLTDKEVWGVAPSGQPLNPTTRIMMAELSTFSHAVAHDRRKHNYMFYIFTVMFLLSRVGLPLLQSYSYLGNRCRPWVWPCFCILTSSCNCFLLILCSEKPMRCTQAKTYGAKTMKTVALTSRRKTRS